MSEHFSEQLIERYRRRVLPPAELLDVDDHMAACELCRRRLGDEPRERAAARSVRADLSAPGMTHLDYERLAAYAEGELDPIDREIADSHLKLCARCDSELDELRAFATRMAAYPAKEYAPAAPPPLGENAPGLWDGVRAFWRSPAFALPVRIAGLLMVIALLFWATSLKSRNFQLQTALDQQRLENEKLKQDFQAANASVAELRDQLAQLKSALPSSSFVVALNDGGGRVTLDKEGNVAGAPPPFQQVVKQTLTAQRVETPRTLTELIGKSGVLMGPADEGHPFALLGPVGTVVISDRPTFRWRALGGADSYVVKIYDADFNEVAVSPRLSETAWGVTRSLERGRTYSWQVTARSGDKDVSSPVKPAPEARFMTLDQAKANELANAKSAAAGSHLTLGVLYAQAGLLDDAERELQALLLANPKSTLAQRLLRSVRAKRR
jgi:anti-sigma factor RsiW